MPDEPAVLEPQEPVADPNAALPEGFGDLGTEMGKVFRSKPPGGVQPPVQPVAPVAPATPAPAAPPAEPVAPVAPTPPIDDGLLPTDLFSSEPKTPAAPEPPAEIPIPEGLTKPKDIATWKELRSKLHAMEAELPQAKAEAEKWKTQYETAQPEILQAKVAETEKINKELSERIAIVDLQIHPEFQRQFVAPRAGLVQNATELIKESDLDPGKFDQAMKLTGKSRRQALDKIIEEVESPTLTGQLGVIFNQIEDLDRRKSGALADAKGNWERLQEHDKTIRYEARQNEIKQAAASIERIGKEFADEHGIVFFKRSATNEEWNTNIDNERKVAIDLATASKDPQQIYKALHMGVAFPRVYNWAINVHKELQKARAELAEFKGADPSLNGRLPTPSATPAANKNLSFAQAAAEGSGLR